METHGRENHLLTRPNSPNNILLHPSQTNMLLILLGLAFNTLPHFGRIQIITPILHIGLAQLPKPPIGLKTLSSPWNWLINLWEWFLKIIPLYHIHFNFPKLPNLKCTLNYHLNPTKILITNQSSLCKLSIIWRVKQTL